MTKTAQPTRTEGHKALGEDQIQELLERLGKALSTGEVSTIPHCWEVPALVLHDEGAVAVSSAGEIEGFFTKATEWYHSRGLVATRPEVERIEALSERLAAVDVRWPAFDKAGVERASERSHYILQLGKDGQPRIRVAMTLQ
jgi:hypothetical protein